MSLRVLHLLSQRPGRTGSGVTLEALVRQAARAGHDQRVLLGTPAEDPRPRVGGLAPERIQTLRFGTGVLDFALPGMSDVMPYASSRFSELDARQLDVYRRAWQGALEALLAEFTPDLVHSHHLWLLSSWLKDWLPAGIPVLNQCHATGFRQMELCPHLAREVIRGCARNEAFCVLHEGHARFLARTLGVKPQRVHRVGAGYRDDLFHARGRERRSGGRMLYVGKLSRAKGLCCLLDAYATMDAGELWVVGGGGAPESEELAERMTGMKGLRLFGAVEQARLAELMRQVDVCVLPSFFEGLPLVLVEAYACGCRLVATDLEGIRRELAPGLGEALQLVAAPAMREVDEPEAGALPGFCADLREACQAALARGPVEPEAKLLEKFTWAAVYERVERVWCALSGRDRGDRC